MKIWHISDTHGFHNDLKLPENIDIVIHSGDCSNSKNKYVNKLEVEKFINWYCELPVKYKIFIAGNHDTSIEKKLFTKKHFEEKNIIYLENESINIEGINIYGSPYTPTFGEGWAFNKSRNSINREWDKIPENTDILITHGPPKQILDLSYDKNNKLEYCGDSALLRRIVFKLKIKYHLFGHIHDNENNINAGIRNTHLCDTIFSNGAVVLDGRSDKGAVYNGNLINY